MGLLTKKADVKVPLQTDATDSSVLLIRTEDGTNAGVFVLARPAAGHDPAGDTPALTFNRYENQYRLVSIWESAAQEQEIPTSR